MRVPPKKGIQGALLARITKILSDENEVLRLGTMPMDPELAQAIRLELEDEDNEHRNLATLHWSRNLNATSSVNTALTGQ
jgi:hypothetical protein